MLKIACGQFSSRFTTLINNLNLKLRKIARFLSNVVLDEMSSAKYRLLFGISFWIAQHEERPFYHIHVVTSRV